MFEFEAIYNLLKLTPHKSDQLIYAPPILMREV